jgi:hypothetical protein
MGLVGGRLAGVFSATVAHHLLEAGINIGRRPVVVGCSDWVDVIVPELRYFGAQITLVGSAINKRSNATDLLAWPGYWPVQVHGFDRVNRVTVTDGESLRQIACDAVVLAGDVRPLRNVDGAVLNGAERVSFIQPTSTGMDPGDVIAFARAKAVQVHSEMGATN